MKGLELRAHLGMSRFSFPRILPLAKGGVLGVFCISCTN